MSDETKSDAIASAAPAPVPAPVPAAEEPAKRIFGPGNGYPRFRIKLDDVLRDEDRAEYEALILRKSTLATLLAWLHERRYDVGRNTVARHRQLFMQDYREVERASRTAHRFARLARSSGATINDSTVGGLHRVLMEFFTREQATEALDPKNLDLLASAVNGILNANAKVASVRKELASAAGAREPVDGKTIVDRVREIVGV